jgi:hypothetical protein
MLSPVLLRDAALTYKALPLLRQTLRQLVSLCKHHKREEN